MRAPSEPPPTANTLRIAVVYALPAQQPLVELQMPSGATVLQAVEQSGLRERFAELSGGELACAIFSRVVPLSAQLHDGDRVEILRPLLIDPKESRRQAAASARRAGSKSG